MDSWVDEEKRLCMYRGFIAAAGLSTRLQGLTDNRNKVLLDLGGDTILGTILTSFESNGVGPVLVAVGQDAPAVRQACDGRAECLLNPFFADHGILSSIWQARHLLDGQPFVFTTGDHYYHQRRLAAFLADQPEAEVLVDVDLKPCDDEDMKVYLNRNGKLRTITKKVLEGPIVGEFTGLVRCSAEGSTQLFASLDRHAWLTGIQGYLADVLCALHRKWELAFHLSSDHHRIDVDFPQDADKARRLYAQEHKAPRLAG
jgi:choline kinase